MYHIRKYKKIFCVIICHVKYKYKIQIVSKFSISKLVHLILEILKWIILNISCKLNEFQK